MSVRGKRTRMVNFFLSEEEYAHLQAEFRASEYHSVSAWIRAILFPRATPRRPQNRAIAASLEHLEARMSEAAFHAAAIMMLACDVRLVSETNTTWRKPM